MPGIRIRLIIVCARNTEVDDGQATTCQHNIRWLEIAMYDGRIKTFMQLNRCSAQQGKNIARNICRRAPATNRIRQRLALHILHNHGTAIAYVIAIHDERKV
ncbi:hypothetical protein SDC9_191425 [bioreactor metagenome]|uniref:Uncharacterized protein n=1 Tax=bioreactor metagenome TaxID=1076179 RepID=A0A645I636_9ZZZZ